MIKEKVSKTDGKIRLRMNGSAPELLGDLANIVSAVVANLCKHARNPLERARIITASYAVTKDAIKDALEDVQKKEASQ